MIFSRVNYRIFLDVLVESVKSTRGAINHSASTSHQEPSSEDDNVVEDSLYDGIQKGDR